ncbi:hypothetical protein RJ639_007589 [Escallonia herrerae]|uniref:Elongator complex protein 4 n=1 Tax=Escallonia herrerae TaxID=1293975 RepID=A0AA89AZU7_9ASTE|nr:hypothetical protein RJ639_007589 [Escallonia herrerae]
MAATKTRTSSFSRNISGVPTSPIPGLKYGPNGTIFVSSGISDLDKILGGGYPLGSLVVVMEDSEAPHHMLLLRNFMSQGLIHKQPLLYASPSSDPRAFLGTLPSPLSSKEDRSHDRDTEQEKGLRIAWQYKKYFGDEQKVEGRGAMKFNKLFAVFPYVFYVTVRVVSSYAAEKYDGKITSAGRIAIQSFCSPQCEFSNMEWGMLSFIRYLKSMSKPNFESDEDKELAKLLTGYQDMVPVILDATTFSMKLHKRRSLVLECLNQAPVDGSSGTSYATSGSCSGSSTSGTLDF